jgi:ankyrin repeat protein
LLRKNAATHILDTHGRSILSIACFCNAEKIVKLLTERGLDEMHRDNFGWTPLHEASFGGFLNIVHILLNYGSEIDACDNSGKTSLYYACQEGHLDVVRLLLNRSGNINLMSHEGTTPFRIACLRNNLKLCEFLLKTNFADIDSVDQDGRTTLEYLIIENKNIEIIELLLKYGANLNGRITYDNLDYETLLHVATRNGNEKCVELLLKYNINKDGLDKYGNSALMVACSNDKPNIVKLLLNKNVSINIKNNQGETALKIASKNETNSNCDILIELLRYSSIQLNNNSNIILSESSSNLKSINMKKLDLIDENVSESVRTSQSIDSFNRSSTITPSISAYPSTYDFTNSSSNNNNNNSSNITKELSISNALINSKFESVGNLSLKVNYPIKKEPSINSSSKFKLIKDKLMRKPSSASKMYQSSVSINNFDKKGSTCNLKQSPSTTSESMSSFGKFISSKFLNKYEPRMISIETLDSNTLEQIDSITASSLSIAKKGKQAKLENNKNFFDMLRNKLKVLTNRNGSKRESTINTTQDFEINFQMHRSVTDYNKMNDLNKRLSSSGIYSNSINDFTKSPTLTSLGATINNNPSSNQTDDTAYIFNRNSLNDCLNSKCSLRNYSLIENNFDNNNNKKISSKNNNRQKLANNNFSDLVMLPSKPKHASKPIKLKSDIINSNYCNNNYCNKSSLNINTVMNNNYDNNNNYYEKKNNRPTSLILNNFKKESSI